MEITWTYNFLESVGFIILLSIGLVIIVRVILILWLWLKFKGWL